MSDFDTPQADRRKHPRMRMDTTLRSICLDPSGVDVVRTLQTVDVSRGGLGAISHRGYYPGQRVVLCLPLSNGTGRRNLYATVLRSQYQEDSGTYRVGMQFDGAASGACAGVDVAQAAA